MSDLVIQSESITYTKEQVQRLAEYSSLNPSIATTIELAFYEKIFPFPKTVHEIGFVARLVEEMKQERLRPELQKWVNEDKA